MKVFYVWGRYDGCGYVRCLLPTIHNGWDGDKTGINNRPIDRARTHQGTKAADIVVFQRPDDWERYKAAAILHHMGKKIVFENDDTYKVEHFNKMGWSLKSRATALDEFIQKADLVTTSTEFLADEYRKLNPNVVVLPNCVDPDDWPEPMKNDTDKVRIGFVGSVTGNGDYDPAKQAIKELSKMDNVQLVVFGMPHKGLHTKELMKFYQEEYDYWMGLDIEWQPLVDMHEYFDTLNGLRLDLLLIPRKDNYFNRCKSNIKFLEASMLEIPVIAQSFSDKLSPYDKDITHGVNGYLVEKDEDWLPTTLKLVNDKKLRETIGKTAKRYTLANYNINDKARLWRDAYKTLL